MEDIDERKFTHHDIIKDGNGETPDIHKIANLAVGVTYKKESKFIETTTNDVLGLNNWYRDKNMSDEEYQAAYKGKQKPILINALDRSVSVQGVTENKISEAIKN